MGVIRIEVPDIGDYKDIPVIDILVEVGQRVEKEQSLVMLESDKATMDVPSPAAGTIKELKVKVGDAVSEGSLIVVLEGEGERDGEAEGTGEGKDTRESGSVDAAVATTASAGNEHALALSNAVAAPASALADSSAVAVALTHTAVAADGDRAASRESHASPSVRKFAREVGVEVSRVQGTGSKGRITLNDVTALIKSVMTGQRAAPVDVATSAGGAGLNLLPWPKIDFAKFGPIDSVPLPRIKKISGANLHRNWALIPHVTNNDEADVTELEALRIQLNKEHEEASIKFTMLAFVIKAVVNALKRFPTLNASLDGDNLVFKQYFHIGFAADTPNGLVVPVVRDADQKGLIEIAKDMSALSTAARDGKLKPEQMQGGCFTISSLGGIGGTSFTPIINAPEVAILGLSRSAIKPVWDGKQFAPRLILPISLSFDHRALDGAEAGRFNAYLVSLLADYRRMLL